MFYWTREEKNSNAEIDFVIQHGPIVLPIEVKSGSEGSLKSLHYFMKLKHLQQAVRIYSGLPKKRRFALKIMKANKLNINSCHCLIICLDSFIDY